MCKISQRGLDKKTEYEMSPVEQAYKFKDYGFKNLHIVDLDGALTGETVNLEIIKDIVNKLDIKICLLYTSPSPRDRQKSRMPSSA